MCNIGNLFVLCDQGDNFRFSKNTAHAADFNIFFGLQGYRTKFVDTDFQGARHHFQKAAGSGGTFIIHDKIGNFSIVIQPDGFAILTADIEDRVNVREEKMRTFSVAADFGYIFVRKWNADTTITRGYNQGNIFPVKSGLFQNVCQCGICTLGRFGSGADN